MIRNFLCAFGVLTCITMTSVAQQTTALGLPYAKDIQEIVQRGELRVAIYPDPTISPFIVVNGGQLSGYNIDLSQTIAKHLGVKLHVDQASSYDEAVAFVANDQDDISISNLTPTYERALSVYFTEPYYVIPFVLVAKNNFDMSRFQLNQEVISTDSSLNISALANSSNLVAVKVAFPQIEVLPYTDLAEAVEKVKSNEYDAILMNKYSAQQAIFGESFLNVYSLGPKHVDLNAIAVNINRPQLLAWLNTYLTSAEGQAEQNALKRKARLE